MAVSLHIGTTDSVPVDTRRPARDVLRDHATVLLKTAPPKPYASPFDVFDELEVALAARVSAHPREWLGVILSILSLLNQKGSPEH